jgi:acylphosphatase
MLVRKKALVSGRVQGVFYRDTCRQVAIDHGVAGAARNLPDGRVEVILEGDPSDVDEVIAWCGSGPRGAVVESVDVTEEEPQGMTGFVIR